MPEEIETLQHPEFVLLYLLCHLRPLWIFLAIQSKIPPSLQTVLQQNTPYIPSEYFGSTPTSEQTCENPFILPTSTQRLPLWLTQAFSRVEPNLVNEQIDFSSGTSLSLPETLSLPSTASITGQTPTFHFKFSHKHRRSISRSSKHKYTSTIRLKASLPLFGHHLDSNRLHNWSLNRLQYRQDIHKDMQEHKLQILTQYNPTLQFEITVKLHNSVLHPLPPVPPNITAQSLPPSIYHNGTYLQIRLIHKTDTWIYNNLQPIFRTIIHMYFLIVFLLKTLPSLVLLEPASHQNSSPRSGPQDLLVTYYDC